MFFFFLSSHLCLSCWSLFPSCISKTCQPPFILLSLSVFANLTPLPPPSCAFFSLIANAKHCLWFLCFAGGRPKEDIMSDQFDCKNCKESLSGRKYIQVEDKPHCIPCYDRLYANTCQECKEIIGHNAKVSSSHTGGVPLSNQLGFLENITALKEHQIICNPL